MTVPPHAQQLFIPGKLPSLNNLIFTKVGSRIRIQKAWTSTVAVLALKAKLRKMKRVHVWYSHRLKDKRSDPSNLAAGCAKVVEDGLVQAKVLKDDGFAEVEGFEHSFRLATPGEAVGVLVTLAEVP